jgi:lipoprotein-anchoring transpeptidase ErfK/SrfK
MPGRPIARRSFLALGGGVGVAGLLAACSGSGPGPGTPRASSAASSTSAASPSGSSSAASIAASSPSSVSPSNGLLAKGSGQPVEVRLFQNDGDSYGVGMPIIAYLSAQITDSTAFAAATKVTVNGAPVAGAWYFQTSKIYSGFPIEAHYRLAQYWPAHSTIELDLPVQGLSAGRGFVFSDNLTLRMLTLARTITTVDGATERLITTSDGKQVFNFPVSLGKATTPTFTGTKVVMELDKVERMIGTTPGDEYNLLVPWSVRLTNSGEFIHAASWNGGNIGLRSTSNGCTNLNTTAAEHFYDFAHIGDVATYTGTGGGPMPVWDGYGDWNLTWAQWQQGGLLTPRTA